MDVFYPRRSLGLACLFVLIGSLLAMATAYAQPGEGFGLNGLDLDAPAKAIETRKSDLEALNKRLSAASDERALLAIRQDLRRLRADAMVTAEPLKERSADLKSDLDKLGPAPTDGNIEAPEISTQRQAITLELAQEDALIRQAALNINEINRLLEDIALRRREAFYGRLLSRSPFAFAPNTLRTAAKTFLEGADDARARAGTWYEDQRSKGTSTRNLIIAAGSLIFSLLIFGPFRRWVNASFLHRLQSQEPTPGRRALFVVLRILTRALPGVFAGFVILSVLDAIGLISELTTPIARQFWFGFVAILVADAGTTAMVSPTLPGWRMVPLDGRSGYTLRAAFSTLVFLLFLDRTLTAGANAFGGAQELVIVQSAILAILIGLIFVFLARPGHWKLTDERAAAFSPDAKHFWRNARRLVTVLGLGIIAAVLAGYVALGHYMATRAVMIGGLIALGLTLHLIAQDTVQLFDRDTRRPLGDAPPTDQVTENFLIFWLIVVADIVIVALLLPVTFLILGAAWSDVSTFIKDAFYGFTIGGVTVSLVRILTAFGTFFLILLVSRSLQRTAQTRFFPRTKIDVGLQNSLKTLIGYVGLLIALMTGVSILGFNLANLAIIAGAMSVGIGFGLQSIVNNFVSGLILLFERPTKVGDWIVVPSGEGHVKSVNVRSTEIETFDRSSIIVPNSELISGSVQN